MPEQRLQKTRDAYREPSWMELTSAQRVAILLGAVRPKGYQFGDAARQQTSAAYRITQTQLAKDADA